MYANANTALLDYTDSYFTLSSPKESPVGPINSMVYDEDKPISSSNEILQICTDRGGVMEQQSLLKLLRTNFLLSAATAMTGIQVLLWIQEQIQMQLPTILHTMEIQEYQIDNSGLQVT